MRKFLALLQGHGHIKNGDSYDVAVEALNTVWHSQTTAIDLNRQTSLEASAGSFELEPASNTKSNINRLMETGRMK